MAAATSSIHAQHPRSARLIDDDPDTTEEDHMKGIKRNRRSIMAMTKSPATVSKRRLCEASSSSASSSSFSSSGSLLGGKLAAAMLLSSTTSQPAEHRSISLASVSGSSHHSRSASYKSDRFSSPYSSCGMDQSEHYVQDDDDEADCTMPAPPSFRRRSTIRDPFDLASSIEDFKHFL